MTIEYDSERKRSTDLESGLAVEWVRDEPPLERRTHFKLIVDGKGTPFESSYDFGDRNIEKEYMNVSAMEIWKKHQRNAICITGPRISILFSTKICFLKYGKI